MGLCMWHGSVYTLSSGICTQPPGNRSRMENTFTTWRASGVHAVTNWAEMGVDESSWFLARLASAYGCVGVGGYGVAWLGVAWYMDVPPHCQSRGWVEYAARRMLLTTRRDRRALTLLLAICVVKRGCPPRAYGCTAQTRCLSRLRTLRALWSTAVVHFWRSCVCAPTHEYSVMRHRQRVCGDGDAQWPQASCYAEQPDR
jgi:hypothetical protein|mmetsp:Transcript_43863/g.99158  ORF Transcript_43863/g.99158 Transcript_43863/m.99158 type:complete len:200 (-) Transcript_43863:587-1186(-)